MTSLSTNVISKSKFSYIQYPFFGTYKVPELDIGFTKIKAKLHKEFKDIKLTNKEDYLTQLLDIDKSVGAARFRFHITAKSTQELIMLDKRCVWGIDFEGTIHNIQRYEEFVCKCVKPDRITKHKYIWFKNISKPFEMPFSIKNIEEDIMYYWFKLLYIDNVWTIYKINTEYEGVNTECI